jgi:hypothetical protein
MDKRGNAGTRYARPEHHFDPAQDLLLESSDVVITPVAFAPRDAPRQPTDEPGRHPAHLDDRAPPRVNRDSAGLGPATGFPLPYGCAAGECRERSDQSSSPLLDAGNLPAFRSACISRRMSSRSGGEGSGCKACDPSTSSGQAAARVEEVHPERPFAKGRLVTAGPWLSRAKTDRA